MPLPEFDDTQELLETIRQELQGHNLPFPQKAKAEPHMPDDITAVSAEHIVQLMTAYEGLKAYAESLASQADAAATLRGSRLRSLRGRKYLELRETKDTPDRLTDNEIKAHLDCDPDLDKLHYQQVKATTYRNLVRSLAESYRDRYNLLSRELTRRTNNGEKE